MRLFLGLCLFFIFISACSSPEENDSVTTTSYLASSIARDIDLYTESVPAIVIGEASKVGEPTLEGEGLGSNREVEIEVSEVLKGDASMKTVIVLIRSYELVQMDESGKTVIPSNEPPLFTEGEHVLVFLGTTSKGEYVSFAGPYGKYLIDEKLNTTSIGDFEMPLSELKGKIQEALANQ